MGDRKVEFLPAKASGAVSAAANSSAMYVADYAEAIIYIAVTALSGTEALIAPIVQISWDNTTWFDHPTHAAFPELVAVENYAFSVPVIGAYLRVRLPAPTGADTPTLTLSIVIEAKN